MASAIFFLDLKGKVGVSCSVEYEDIDRHGRPYWRVTTEEIFPCPLSKSSPYSSAKLKRRAPQFHHASPTREST
jgi:hypothetical protein